MPKPNIPVETLIEQLHGPDWMARCDAARLLGQSRDPRALVALLPDLNDKDWRVRRNATQALGALRDKRAVEPLIRMLSDKTATVRQRAMVALGRIKDPASLPALLNLLLNDKTAEYDAYQAIRKFGKKAMAEVVSAYEKSSHPRLMMLLVEMKYEGAAELLITLLESQDVSTRLMAIRELGKLKSQRVTGYLLRQLNSPDLTVQSEAIRALGKLGSKDAIPALLDLLQDEDLYGPRSGLYHAVTEAFQSLAGITKEIENAFPVKYPTMFSIGSAPISLPEAMSLLGGSQLQTLDTMLSNMENRAAEIAESSHLPPEVIKKAVEEAAWKFGVMFADARDAREDRARKLMELLVSESALERAAAAVSLPWYTDEKAIPPLKHATMDSDETVRRTAIWALAALESVLKFRGQLGL